MIGISKLYCGTVESSDVLRYGKKSKDLAKSAGYDKLIGTLEDIKTKRNGFLHTAVVMKVENEEHKIGKLRFFYPRPKEFGMTTEN